MMITRDVEAFLPFARNCSADFGPGTAKAAFLVTPLGFGRAGQSAQDNRYMAGAQAFDAAAALRQHAQLQRALATELPVFAFAGDPATPDAVFPNNVFATCPGKLIVGRMRHPVRQREAEREDIRAFFRDVLGRREVDLSLQPHPCELTGSLVIDRARGLGFCGLSERCDEAGARLMHEAFGLRATLMFELASGEYHANVVLAVLAGRAALACPDGFATPELALRLLSLYGDGGVALDAGQRNAFAGNAISLSPDSVWMSERAGASLNPSQRASVERNGFRIRTVPLDALEVAGGSLRCCVGEIF